MRVGPVWCGVWMLGLAFVSGRHVVASVVVPTELREIVDSSTRIVRGVITDVRVVRIPDEGVASIGTVAIETTLKGPVGAVLFVRVPGGERGRYRVIVPGAPELRLNERAVFFLKRSDDAVWVPVGLAAGIARVGSDPRSRRTVVLAPPVLLGYTAPVGVVRRGDTRRQLVALADFESLVRMVVAGGRANAGGTP